jgi:hypothetical protein
MIYPLMYYIVVSDLRYRTPVLWLSLLPAGYFLSMLTNRNHKGGGEAEQPVAKRA